MKKTVLFNLICLSILSIICFSSCSAYRSIPAETEYNNAWVGKTHNEIVLTYGAPDRVESDGNNGSILVYEDFTTYSSTRFSPHYGYFYGPNIYTDVNTDKSYVHFFMNANDVCYLVRTNQALPGGENDRINRTILGSCLAAALVLPILLRIPLFLYY